MEDKGIDVPKLESVCVDRPYSTGKPVKIDFAGGDADIYQTQPGELKNSLLE